MIMSVSAIASLRPLRNQCLSTAKFGLLSIRITSRASTIGVRAKIPLDGLRKAYSTKPIPGAKENEHQSSSEKKDAAKGQPISFRHFVGRNLAGGLRLFANAFTIESMRGAYRAAPFVFSLKIAFGVLYVIVMAMILYGFTKRFYNDYFAKYPEPVRNTLRRAIYYTDFAPDNELALKFYKKALAEAKEVGLHAFSDLVLGIRIKVTEWCEKSGNYPSAVANLELLYNDCNDYLRVWNENYDQGKISPDGFLWDQQQRRSDGEVFERPPETLYHARQRVLRHSVQIATKIGEICASQYVMDPEKSHKYLLLSVETALKEFARVRKEGIRPGEEQWLSPTQLGGSMESLANGYERKSEYQFAIPLYFQALRLCDLPCHRAVIMNNMSATFAQYPLYAPTLGDGNIATPEALKEVLDSAMPGTREDCLEAAMNWAKNAYQHGKDVKGEERTEECDIACATALCNWGDVASMLGKKKLAKKKFGQAIKMSQKFEFEEGVKKAREGLARLEAPELEKPASKPS